MNRFEALNAGAWRWLYFIFCAFMLSACDSGSGDKLDTNGNPIAGNRPPPQPSDDLFSKVQAVFDARCIACHAGAAAPQGLILTAGQSYDQIVGVPSAQQNNILRIAPGLPNDSYLVRKIRGDAGITGAQMPRNGPPFLSAEQINTIVAWVEAGAPEAQDVPPPSEFEAKISDFAGYSNWQAVDYSIGLTNEALAGLHGSNAELFARRVFANAIAVSAEGEEFPIGSIFVKEVFSFEGGDKTFADEGGLLAMVKRGGEFNQDHGAWEWFMLSENASSILARGANLMDGGCNACHLQASLDEDSRLGGVDYVFAHQSEFAATSAWFSDYQSWSLIDDRNDQNVLLDGMAHGADIPGSSRRIYKKQMYANADTIAQGYPIATTFVKEVVDNQGAVVEVTAMVKRGGNFNSANGFWEWFMLEPVTGAIMQDEAGVLKRGANLMDGMCNGCHFAANPTRGEGIDFVFKHSGDPFNNNDEFFAELAAFEDYKSWDLVDYSVGASNPAIGGGHQGQNDAYARKVFANSNAMTFEGQVYSKGSIFVKEVTTWEGGEETFPGQLGLVAMVKRGGNFNTAHGGWEWFELEPDLRQVIGRGGDYRNNGCNNCHTQATSPSGADYVFNHPSEFVAQNSDFSDYQQWRLIDERNDDNPLLGGMAHRAGDQVAVRKVFKKQPYAKPLSTSPGYPIGTIFVKETSIAGEVVEITAMAKRVMTTADGTSGWEWFMLDPSSGTIAEPEVGMSMRGFDLMDGMCAGCHSLANDSDDGGGDFVFPHINDPFYSSAQ